MIWLTDGTTWVHMLNPLGFMVSAWEPGRPPVRADMHGSALADGQLLGDYHWDDITDEWVVEMRHHSQDLLIEETQRLDALLVQALDYNRSPWAHDPVYIKAKAPEETNYRYALVKTFGWYQDSYPYASPHYGVRESGMAGRRMTITHGPWMAHPPGQGECTPVNNLQAYYDPATASAWYEPGQSSDDVTANYSFGDLEAMTDAALIMGNGPGAPICHSYGFGIRFRNVQVPPGARVAVAYVRFTAAGDDAEGTCKVDIRAQATAVPVEFLPFYGDFTVRPRTTAKVDWDDIGGWVTGNTYDSPALASVVQEVIDLPEWEAGNDLVLFFEDDGSTCGARRQPYAWDNGADSPQLCILAYVPEIQKGTPNSCANVHVVNKHVTAQITDMYYYNSTTGTWSSNLIGAAPTAILPDPPVAGDHIYVGINTALPDAGIFDNIIFDMLTPSAGTITWALDYWNGAWTNMASNVPLDPLENVGVNSVFWDCQSDWVTTAVQGVTGYWVRMRVVSVGAGASAPVVARDPYTATANYITIDGVEGVLPALARMGVWNYSPMLSSPTRFPYNHPARMFVGLRSIERGEDFRSFLNCSEGQHPEGVSFTVRSGLGINASLTSALTFGTTGRRLLYAAAGIESWGPVSEKAMWTFTAEASRQYQGRYRALLRGYVSSGTTGDVQVRLCLGYQGPITSVTYWRSEIADAPASSISWIDLGVIELWGMPFGRGQTGSGYYSGIIIEAACNVAAARNLYLYDLFLLPYDEWAADWSQPPLGWTMAIMGSLSGQIDSLTTPLESKGYLAYGAEDRFFLPSVLVTTGPAILPARKRLRLHWAFNETVPSGYAYQMLNAVKVQHNARYSGSRGRR